MTDLEPRVEELIDEAPWAKVAQALLEASSFLDVESSRNKAEEALLWLNTEWWEGRKVIEQLLSENRQVRELELEVSALKKGYWYVAYIGELQQTASLRQDLDRISAEREACRAFIIMVSKYAYEDSLREKARRILAENDR